MRKRSMAIATAAWRSRVCRRRRPPRAPSCRALDPPRRQARDRLGRAVGYPVARPLGRVPSCRSACHDLCGVTLAALISCGARRGHPARRTARGRLRIAGLVSTAPASTLPLGHGAHRGSPRPSTTRASPLRAGRHAVEPAALLGIAGGISHSWGILLMAGELYRRTRRLAALLLGGRLATAASNSRGPRDPHPYRRAGISSSPGRSSPLWCCPPRSFPSARLAGRWRALRCLVVVIITA